MRQLYQYIRKERTPPTNTMWSQQKKEYTSNTNEILELIQNAWEPVFNRHRQAPPRWDAFEDKYGQYFANWTPAPSNTPSAEELCRQARKMRAQSSPGYDGWRPAELRVLPSNAWVQRKKVLDLSIQLRVFPTCSIQRYQRKLILISHDSK